MLTVCLCFIFTKSVSGYSGFASIVACVASVSVRLSARSMHFSLLWPREIGGRKKVRGGGGERREGNACPQTHNFEKPVRPRTEFPDWRGTVVLIAK